MTPSCPSCMRDAHFVLLLLPPAVSVITLGVGFHGHRWEKVLHGVIAQVKAHRPEPEQIPTTQRP